MTLNEKLLVSAYTGVLLCDHRQFLSYASKVLEHEVSLEDLRQQSIWDALRLRVSADFGAIGDTPDTPEADHE